MIDEAEDAVLIIFAQAVFVEILGFFEVVGAFLGWGGDGETSDGDLFYILVEESQVTSSN